MSNAHKNFSEAMWKNEPTKRYEIVSDLLEKYNLIGMDRDGVISLLGEPRDDIYSSYRCMVDTSIGQSEPREEFDLSKENFLFYSLVEAVIPDHKRSLFIRLDENDVIIGVYFVNLAT